MNILLMADTKKSANFFQWFVTVSRRGQQCFVYFPSDLNTGNNRLAILQFVFAIAVLFQASGVIARWLA